jgi:hypothetical protein
VVHITDLQENFRITVSSNIQVEYGKVLGKQLHLNNELKLTPQQYALSGALSGGTLELAAVKVATEIPTQTHLHLQSVPAMFGSYPQVMMTHSDRAASVS